MPDGTTASTARENAPQENVANIAPSAVVENVRGAIAAAIVTVIP
jgi:hypothetical protein